MLRHKTGSNREQISLDALINEENTVRAIGATVNRFDIIELDFTHSKTKDTGRKLYSLWFGGGLAPQQRPPVSSGHKVATDQRLKTLAFTSFKLLVFATFGPLKGHF